MLAAALFAILPEIVLLAIQSGSWYLGKQTNIDDHMVYAAWMRQGAEGHFLFDNRFTAAPQPGLTIHVYFLVLGWISAVFGYAFTEAIARAAFGALFVWLLAKLVRRLTPCFYTFKLAISTTVIGGGIGFMLWHTFGKEIVRPEFTWAKPLTLGWLPVDVWQPEVFVFPSLLTSSLFMVSLCLILTIFLSVLSAKDSWKRVPLGFLGMALLMNIHSYDVLTVTLVLVTFLVAQVASKQVDMKWVGRVVVIGCGAILPALWFLYVLKNDPVFQARAATLTYSSGFRQVFFGLFGLIAFGIAGLFVEGKKEKRNLVGAGILIGVLGTLFALAEGEGEKYWMSWGAWAVAVGAVFASVCFLAGKNPTRNLVVSWAAVSLVAPYIPQLFQRKLLMGAEIPWALLTALGIAAMVINADRNKRNLVTVLVLSLLGGSSIRWFQRELQLGVNDVSNTTTHSVNQPNDLREIVDYLLKNKGAHTVVMAMPGVPTPPPAGQYDNFGKPYITDLNPFLSGLAGVYTYAGHWSETPDYSKRRGECTSFFLNRGVATAKAEFLAESKIEYLIAPKPEIFQMVPLIDASAYGEVVVRGKLFDLIKVSAARR